MSTHTYLSILLFLTIFTVTATSITIDTTSKKPTKDFIISKCSTTSYPTKCVQSLYSFSNKIQKSPKLMAQTALLVSLSKAHYTKTYMGQISHTKGLKPNEKMVIKDCNEEIGDAVDRLDKSVHEFKIAVRSRARDFLWHMSSVQTWASAAITDVNTCIDEVKDLNLKIKPNVIAKFQDVMQCTSNALALINQFANSN